MFILSLLSSTLFASSVRPPAIEVKDDDRRYRIMCDRTRKAAFTEGLTGTGHCKMIFKEAAEYVEAKIAKKEPICDDSVSGQAARKFLGSACDAPESLQTVDTIYRRIQICDASRDGKALEAFLGPKHCLVTYEPVHYAKPHRGSDGTMHDHEEI